MGRNLAERSLDFGLEAAAATAADEMRMLLLPSDPNEGRNELYTRFPALKHSERPQALLCGAAAWIGD